MYLRVVGQKERIVTVLQTTCNTDTKVRKSKTDKVLYEVQDLFAGGWDVGSVGTFIKGVHDKINWTLVWNGEHLLETLR